MSDYAGDIAPGAAWRLLSEQPGALLIDVRTEAEWSFVGLPDLTGLGRQPLLVAWALFPGMSRNERFLADLQAALTQAGYLTGSPLLFLCRSGARSRHAAVAATAAGLGPSYNIAGGFEGDLDAQGQRGGRNGWKYDRLPWKQS